MGLPINQLPGDPSECDSETKATVTVTLWQDGYLGEVELLAVPREGERVVDSQGRHFKVKSVMHCAASNSLLARTSTIQLNVEEY